MFDITNNANNSSYEPDILPLSSLYIITEIPDPPKRFNPAANYDKPVTQSQHTLNKELFSFLSSANTPEVPEPKTYKPAVCNQNLRHNDWKTALHEKIDFLISNNTWMLMQLPPGRTTIDSK